MVMPIQNRSVLYKTPEPVLVPEGVYEAELVEVKEFSNAFGNRVGLVFKITTGQHEGVELMESAAVSTSPRGKLVELMRGMGRSAGNPVEPVGQHCKVAVKHESNKVGKRYAAITQTFRPWGGRGGRVGSGQQATTRGGIVLHPQGGAECLGGQPSHGL